MFQKSSPRPARRAAAILICALLGPLSGCGSIPGTPAEAAASAHRPLSEVEANALGQACLLPGTRTQEGSPLTEPLRVRLPAMQVVASRVLFPGQGDRDNTFTARTYLLPFGGVADRDACGEVKLVEVGATFPRYDAVRVRPGVDLAADYPALSRAAGKAGDRLLHMLPSGDYVAIPNVNPKEARDYAGRLLRDGYAQPGGVVLFQDGYAFVPLRAQAS